MSRLPPRKLSPKLELLIFIALALVCVSLRVFRLSEWQWDGDEYSTLSEIKDWIQGSGDSIGWVRATSWLTHTLLSVPYGWLDSETLALRILPCLAGIILVLGSYVPLRRLFGHWAALSWMFVVSLSPLATHASSYARYQSFLLLFGAVALIGAAHAVQRKRGRTLLISLVGIIIAGSCHLSGLILIPPFLVILVLLPTWQGRVAPAWISVLFLGGLGVLLLVCFRDSWQHVLDHVTSDFKQHPTRYSPLRLLGSLVFQGGLGVWLFAAVGAWLSLRQRIAGGRVAIIFIAVPLTLLIAASGTYAVGPRYAFAAMPAVYLLAALGIGRTLDAMGNSPWPARGLILMLAVASQIPTLASNLLAENSRYTIKSVALLLKGSRIGTEEDLEKDVILAESHAVLSHYMGLDSIELPRERDHIQEMIEGRNRVFVVAHFQRGKLIGVTDPSLQQYLEETCYLCSRWVSRRFDLYRFEVRLYSNRPAHESLTSALGRRDL